MGLSAGGSGGGKLNAEPNVTPMIDVMLVLLIIFMIVVPAIAAGFNAQPPSGINLKGHPEEDEDQVLGIDRDGNYYLNKRPLAKNDLLGDELKRIYELRTVDKILFIKADKSLKYARVIDAMDIAAKNGVRVTGMISEQVPGTESTIQGDIPKPEGSSGKKGIHIPGGD